MVPSLMIETTFQQRLGLHYYPDTLHYREADLAAWLPELEALGASWLVLRSELDRAIPEHFILGLKQAGIEPIIHFQPPFESVLDLREQRTLLEAYARWGARYLIFFDRPNARSSWAASGWAQQDLVERFLDRFLPVAGLANTLGLTPVLPPLEPGGSYWDTAFLRSALQGIERRKQERLLQNMALSAYAWMGGHSLDWGTGGPERWPLSRPYLTPAGSQDQRGFRVFDWYQAVAQAVLQQPCPILLLQAGCPSDPQSPKPQQDTEEHYTDTCISIAKLLRQPYGDEDLVMDPLDASNPLEPIPAQVIACNFWLLSDEANSPYASAAWYRPDGSTRPVVSALKDLRRAAQEEHIQRAASKNQNEDAAHPIRHYLLLPGFEWGVSDWYLEIIRPYVKKHQPTIGFSLEEARLAARVTVVGNSPIFSEERLNQLRQAGCWVEQIVGDGTSIATQLAER